MHKNKEFDSYDEISAFILMMYGEEEQQNFQTARNMAEQLMLASITDVIDVGENIQTMWMEPATVLMFRVFDWCVAHNGEKLGGIKVCHMLTWSMNQMAVNKLVTKRAMVPLNTRN